MFTMIRTTKNTYQAAANQTSTAIAAVRSVGMEQADGQLFLAQYWDGACYIVTGGAYLQSGPGTNYQGTLLDGGTPVFVIDNGENQADGHRWFQVAVNGYHSSATVGYVAAEPLEGSPDIFI